MLSLTTKINAKIHEEIAVFMHHDNTQHFWILFKKSSLFSVYYRRCSLNLVNHSCLWPKYLTSQSKNNRFKESNTHITASDRADNPREQGEEAIG